MHRGLPEGNTKLVLILFSALGPSDLGPGLRLLQRVLPSPGDAHRTPSCDPAPTLHPSCHHVVQLAYLNEVQQCKCMNACDMRDAYMDDTNTKQHKNPRINANTCTNYLLSDPHNSCQYRSDQSLKPVRPVPETGLTGGHCRKFWANSDKRSSADRINFVGSFDPVVGSFDKHVFYQSKHPTGQTGGPYRLDRSAKKITPTEL